LIITSFAIVFSSPRSSMVDEPTFEVKITTQFLKKQ
jgi:hypothetical protein